MFMLIIFSMLSNYYVLFTFHCFLINACFSGIHEPSVTKWCFKRHNQQNPFLSTLSFESSGSRVFFLHCVRVIGMAARRLLTFSVRCLIIPWCIVKKNVFILADNSFKVVYTLVYTIHPFAYECTIIEFRS